MLDLGQLLEQSGAILRGHFILTSGRHSDVYFEKFRVLERPDVLSALSSQLAASVDPNEIDFVVGPTTGGIIIAFEVARQMGKPAVYVEVEDGKRVLRRGKTLQPGSRCLVVDDVLTTGRSLKEIKEVVESAGATVAAYGVLIDRTESPLELGAPIYAAHKVVATSYAADEVPGWLQAIPTSKPGTRA